MPKVCSRAATALLLGWLVLAWTMASFAADKPLGQSDLGTSEFPPQETPLIDGTIAFRQHNGGHTAGFNRPTSRQFYVAIIAPRDEPSAPKNVDARSARHAER